MQSHQIIPPTHDIEHWIRAYIASSTGAAIDEIDADCHFDSFGMDSIQAVEMITGLEGWLGTGHYLPLDSIFDAPSISDAAAQLGSILSARRQ